MSDRSGLSNIGARHCSLGQQVVHSLLPEQHFLHQGVCCCSAPSWLHSYRFFCHGFVKICLAGATVDVRILLDLLGNPVLCDVCRGEQFRPTTYGPMSGTYGYADLLYFCLQAGSEPVRGIDYLFHCIACKAQMCTNEELASVTTWILLIQDLGGQQEVPCATCPILSCEGVPVH